MHFKFSLLPTLSTLLAMAVLVGAGNLHAQSSGGIPYNPNTVVRDGKKKTKEPTFNEGGSSATNGARIRKPDPTYETTVVLGKDREWQNKDGKKIKAHLLSWPMPGNLKNTKDLQLEIVRQGKVRLRRDKKIYVMELKELSDYDQQYIKKLAAAHRASLKKKD